MIAQLNFEPPQEQPVVIGKEEFLNNLVKGDTVTIAQLEWLTGLERDDDIDAFRLAVLGLKEQIEAIAFRGYSQDWSLSMPKGCLHINTDAEAIEVEERRFQNALKALERSNRKTRGIDVKNLSPEELNAYDASCRRQSPYIQGIRRIRGRGGRAPMVPERKRRSEMTVKKIVNE